MGHQVAARFRFSLSSPAKRPPSSVYYAVKTLPPYWTANAVNNIHIKDLHHMTICHYATIQASWQCACSVCSVKEFHVKYKVHQPLTKQAKVVYSETLVKSIQASQSACAVVKILVKDYAIAHLQASEEVLWKRLKQARAMCTQWKTLKQASTMCTQWKRVKASSVQCAQCPTASVHSVKKIHVKALWPSEGKWHTRTGNISWHFYESLAWLEGKQCYKK